MVLLAFASCKKNDQGSVPTNNLVANVGIAQTTTFPADSVLLDGSASTGTIFSYQWRKVAGPASFTIQNPTAAKTFVKYLVQGIYKFELEITDSKGNSSKAMVQVTVILLPHNIKAKITEYGTGIPLADATVDVLSVLLPYSILPGTKILTPTDLNGECSFPGYKVTFREFSKPGYWNTTMYLGTGGYQFSPILLFPTPTSYNFISYTSGSHLCDSFVVKMFPIKYIKIRVIDSLGLNTCLDDCYVMFGVNGLFSEHGIRNAVYPNFYGNGQVLLRPAIDTTFQYPVFGNTDNQFMVTLVGDFGPNLLYSDTVFIANSSNRVIKIAF